MSEPRDLRIYRYVAKTIDNAGRERQRVPKDIDYRTGLVVGLTEAVAHESGRRSHVEYRDPVSSDVVLTEDYAYQPGKRLLTITWFREDGAPHEDTKTTVRVFESRDATVREIFSLLREHGGGSASKNRNARRLLWTTHKADFEDYALSGDDSIITSITNDVTLLWLDSDVAGLSIRQHILDRLNASL